MAWTGFDRRRLSADVSLWSADLASLGAEISRVDAYADSYHLDVADAHFAPGLLFFPDLVRALRPHTRRPFHVHLMVERPADLAPEFAAAGADLITVHAEAEGAAQAVERIRRSGRLAGIALLQDTPVAAANTYLDGVAVFLLLGTGVGVKGCEPGPEAYSRIREAKAAVRGRGSGAAIIADGGIRTHTVPALRQAGADVVVPGSLVFQSGDLEATFGWLHSLPGAES